MLSRSSIRTLCSRAKNAFQALRVVSYAVFTTAGATILQRFIRYFFPDADTDSGAPRITNRTSPLQPLMKSAPTSKIVEPKSVTKQAVAGLKDIIKSTNLQPTLLSAQLFYHSSTPPTKVLGKPESKVAKFN